MSLNITSAPSLTARVTCYTFVDMAMGVLRILSMVALLSAETKSLSLFLPLFMVLDAVGTHLRPDYRACEGKRTVIKRNKVCMKALISVRVKRKRNGGERNVVPRGPNEIEFTTI